VAQSALPAFVDRMNQTGRIASGNRSRFVGPGHYQIPVWFQKLRSWLHTSHDDIAAVVIPEAPSPHIATLFVAAKVEATRCVAGHGNGTGSTGGVFAAKQHVSENRSL
jgi:hypothetical protein